MKDLDIAAFKRWLQEQIREYGLKKSHEEDPYLQTPTDGKWDAFVDVLGKLNELTRD